MPINFPRQVRMLKPRDFRRVFAKPTKKSNAYFLALYHSNSGEHARLGLAISKKKIAKATQRNRLKRVIRESFRAERPNLPAIDIIILPKYKLATVDKQAARRALDALWAKLK